MKTLNLMVFFLLISIFSFGQKIINNPYVKISSSEYLSIASIELSDKFTIVNCKFQNGNYYGAFIRTQKPGSKKAFYIADEIGNRISDLKNVKNLSHDKRVLSPNETVVFSLIFAPIDSTVKVIDIIEGNTNVGNWCFYGVKLDGSYNKIGNIIPTSKNEEIQTLKSSGTGFLINIDGYVITNYHVIEDANALKLVFESGIEKKVLKATVVMTDKTNDIAIVKVTDTSFVKPNYIPYNLSDKYDVGDNVFTLGYPQPDIMGLEAKLTTGIINSLSGIDNDNTCMQISVQIQPGNSGGPLFNDNGDVVGITTSTLNSIFMAKYKGNIPQNVNYAVKSEYIKVLCKNIDLPMTGLLKNMELKEKVKVIRNYTCLILVY